MTSWTLKRLLDGDYPRDSRMARWDRKIARVTLDLVLLLAIACVTSALLQVHYRVSYSGGAWDYDFSIGSVSQIYGYLNPDTAAPELKNRLPGEALPYEIGAYLPIPSAGIREHVLIRLVQLPMTLLALLVVWMVRGIVLTTLGTDTADGDPFVRANVRRLRWIALALIVTPLAEFISSIASFELQWSALKGIEEIGMYWTGVSYALAGVGILALVLAEVFAKGIRLREDVEGLV